MIQRKRSGGVRAIIKVAPSFLAACVPQFQGPRSQLASINCFFIKEE